MREYMLRWEKHEISRLPARVLYTNADLNMGFLVN